eukprot:CAMPEP_0167798864 /NCGR_PEP_ID=MMETSP0111_2-20121227/16617_1 /TAXON_ID=91324 /ORGANISM="Lotharella globosa, Strain CCCM811" /LENGTH=115 /DNA_ID=CAMNT_0007693469 /DNA_START=89 /DNA_END=432 /DNA_ORIENTATION=-
MFWESAFNISLFGIWRLLLILILIGFEFEPSSNLDRMKTIVILITEETYMTIMYVYNLLKNVVGRGDDIYKNCGSPPLNEKDCPEEAILGIWITDDFGSAVSLNIVIIFLVSLYA